MPAYAQLAPTALHALMQAPEAERPHLLDVREPWEYDLARIDGSENVPMGEIPARFEELDKTRSTVVICHHGVRSLQVVAFLQHHGFTNLHNLSGGIDRWSREVDSRVALY
jgi:rhodanese-related sulfurtransferase